MGKGKIDKKLNIEESIFPVPKKKFLMQKLKIETAKSGWNELQVSNDFCGQLDKIISILSISEPFTKLHGELLEIVMSAREKLIKLKNDSCIFCPKMDLDS